MKSISWEILRAYRPELYVGMVLAAALGVGALGKRRFAAEAATWPAARAKIENVFIDVQNQGRYRTPVTHAVLGYGYSVGDLYYSGEIRLRAGETSLEPLDKEMVGQQVSIQFSPQEPGASIFLKHGVRGQEVVKDRRLSGWSWLDRLT